MTILKPKIAMILMYAFFIWIFTSIVFFFLANEYWDKWDYLLLGFGLTLIGSISLALRLFLLPYYAIEIDEQFISGPSLFGVGWRRIKISIKEIMINANINQILVFLGVYPIKSTKGEIIGIWGFDEDQYSKLLSLIEERKKK